MLEYLICLIFHDATLCKGSCICLCLVCSFVNSWLFLLFCCCSVSMMLHYAKDLAVVYILFVSLFVSRGLFLLFCCLTFVMLLYAKDLAFVYILFLSLFAVGSWLFCWCLILHPHPPTPLCFSHYWHCGTASVVPQPWWKRGPLTSLLTHSSAQGGHLVDLSMTSSGVTHTTSATCKTVSTSSAWWLPSSSSSPASLHASPSEVC